MDSELTVNDSHILLAALACGDGLILKQELLGCPLKSLADLENCRWQKRYRLRPDRGGGSSERELSGPVTGGPLASEPNRSSPATANQRGLYRWSSPRD